MSATLRNAVRAMINHASAGKLRAFVIAIEIERAGKLS